MPEPKLTVLAASTFGMFWKAVCTSASEAPNRMSAECAPPCVSLNEPSVPVHTTVWTARTASTASVKATLAASTDDSPAKAVCTVAAVASNAMAAVVWPPYVSLNVPPVAVHTASCTSRVGEMTKEPAVVSVITIVPVPLDPEPDEPPLPLLPLA